MKKVLFVGESWSATLMEVKDSTVFYHLNMKQDLAGSTKRSKKPAMNLYICRIILQMIIFHLLWKS